MVTGLHIAPDSVDINGTNVTLTLTWKEPFNNFDPIVNYTVSCSGDVACPPNFTTTDNTTRSTITNLTPKTSYTFSVAATNSIGSGEADVWKIFTAGESIYLCMCLCVKYSYIKTHGSESHCQVKRTGDHYQ